ncbi:MAG: radical SAM protein [candidate division Zixibacteria bacterium]|nr:radical SAM protein [candidate division Zixibacteria bacterium]
MPPVASHRLAPDSAEAAQRVRQAMAMLEACSVCPRMCGTARLAGEIGLCRAGEELKIASWNLHRGEEPPISGHSGSGTVFLSGCSLRCLYCQNYPISQYGAGDGCSVERLVEIMLELAGMGAHNINFVTPTHYAPQIMDAILRARRQGMAIPIVWNTSGYERVEMLKLLDGIVDIYLADMRYGDDNQARKYSKIPDYVDVNRAAIAEMHRQVGVLALDTDGIAQRGLLVRHLVLPGGVAGSAKVFKFLANSITPETAVSVMSQYFPAHKAVDDSLLKRRLTEDEYRTVLAEFEAAGLENGYCQDY